MSSGPPKLVRVKIPQQDPTMVTEVVSLRSPRGLRLLAQKFREEAAEAAAILEALAEMPFEQWGNLGDDLLGELADLREASRVAAAATALNMIDHFDVVVSRVARQKRWSKGGLELDDHIGVVWVEGGRQ